MRILLKTGDQDPAIYCSVCGQGFVSTWERESEFEKGAALVGISQALREHHRGCPGREAHPGRGFEVQEWSSLAAFPGVALPGTAPTWAL